MQEAPTPAAKDPSSTTAVASPGELLTAAKSRDITQIQRQLLLGADPNERDALGWSPLHFAAEDRSAEAADLLIHYLADVDLQQDEGATAAFVAAQDGHASVLAALIRASANVSLTTTRGSTPLHAAIQFGRIECARLLINAAPRMDQLRLDGWTPLLIAVRNCDFSLVSKLIEAGVDVDGRDGTHGGSALHIAAHRGFGRIVELLIGVKASIDIRRRSDGVTPLFIAAEMGHTGVARLLIRAGADVTLARLDGPSPVYIAAQNGYTDIVHQLIRAGADVDAATSAGVTPLNIAVQLGRADIVEQLIRASAWLDPPSVLDGHAPLHSAATLGSTGLVARLVAACANVDVTTAAGCTPLLLAAEREHTTVARQLIDAATNLDLLEKTDGMSALYAATKKGSAATVERLLAAGANPDLYKRANDTSPLWMASQSDRVDLVVSLLRIGRANPDSPGMAGATPLYIAAQNGHVGVVDELVRVTSNVDIPTRQGASPLYIAAEYGRSAVVRRLLRAAATVDQEERHGCSPIWTAAQRGHHEVVQLLLHAGAAIDRLNTAGYSPLHIAAQMGQARAVDVLIRAAANVDTQNLNGESPLYTAAVKGHVSVIGKLAVACASTELRGSSGCTALWLAAEAGHVEVVEQLIRARANANFQRDDGVTPLWIAAQLGHGRIVEQLLAASASVELERRSGSSALYIASEFGHADIADALTRAAADVDQQTRTGAAPLHAAAQNGHADVVDRLARAAADIDHRRADGASPLWLACQNGHTGAVARLISASADVDRQLPGGAAGSPLWMAAQNGHASIVALLLRAGACVDLRDDRSGSTPLYAAAIVGHSDVADKLIRASADVDAEERLGRTPLCVAVEGGHADVVESLVLAGADDFHRPDEGSQLVCVAAQNGYATVVEVLLRARCKHLNLGRGSGASLRLSANELIELTRCLDFAFYRGHVDFVLHFVKMFMFNGHLFEFCGAALIPFFPDFSGLMTDARYLQPPAVSSTDLYKSLLLAGFSTVNSTLQTGTAAVVEDIARLRLGPDVFIVGSFADGWGNCLTRLCGRTDADSDIDVTLIANTKSLHVCENLPSGSKPPCCKQQCRPVEYDDGHVRHRFDANSPTRPHLGSMLRPAFDNVNALPCCNYPPIELLRPSYRTQIDAKVLAELKATRDSTQCHVVAAAPPGLEGTWMRVSTNLLERKLMQSLNSVQGQLFIILKYLLKRVIAKRVKGLKTYHAKNLLFRLLDETPRQEWRPCNLIRLVRKSLHLLVVGLRDTCQKSNACMSHFFLRDAAVYLRRGRYNRRDLALAVSTVIDELPKLLSEYQRQLVPSETGLVDFHPFLLIPFSHRVNPMAAQIGEPSVRQYTEIYDLVRDLLIRLGDTGGSSDGTEQLMLDIEKLPDCAGTAREGLRALALLRAGKALKAEALISTAVKGVRCPVGGLSSAASKELVWQQILQCDCAWKFCFEASTTARLKFRFLPKPIRRAFPWGSGSYGNLLYINFDALLKGLRLELFADVTAPAAELFEDAVAGDADPQELLMLLQYCTNDEDALVRAVHNNRDTISSTGLNRIVVAFIENEPALANKCRDATLEALVNQIDVHGILGTGGPSAK